MKKEKEKKTIGEFMLMIVSILLLIEIAVLIVLFLIEMSYPELIKFTPIAKTIGVIAIITYIVGSTINNLTSKHKY